LLQGAGSGLSPIGGWCFNPFADVGHGLFLIFPVYGIFFLEKAGDEEQAYENGAHGQEHVEERESASFENAGFNDQADDQEANGRPEKQFCSTHHRLQYTSLFEKFDSFDLYQARKRVSGVK
jgi:hypothetical protein